MKCEGARGGGGGERERQTDSTALIQQQACRQRVESAGADH